MQTVTLETKAAPPITEQFAQQIAARYVAEEIDATFAVVSGAYYESKPDGRKLWRFFVRHAAGPLGIVLVDPDTKAVLPLTDNEIAVMREKAAILIAHQRGLPAFGADGYVLGEYARRQANHYLSTYVGLQAIATSALFVPLERPVWQFLIEVHLPTRGAIGVFGLLDVDARSGEVIPLSDEQIQQIWSRGNAAEFSI
ncbi:MAG: hypothetical protein U0350_42945 [Caldilineaceae bacterium]